MPKGMNRPLLLLQPFVRLTLHTGEKIEGKANYSDESGVEIFIADRDEFRWIGRDEIKSRSVKP